MFWRGDSLLYLFIADHPSHFSCHMVFNFFCLSESNLAQRERVEVLWLKQLWDITCLTTCLFLRGLQSLDTCEHFPCRPVGVVSWHQRKKLLVVYDKPRTTKGTPHPIFLGYDCGLSALLISLADCAPEPHCSAAWGLLSLCG